ncbi:FAD-binding oxidoreductase [Billgrantia endophytica]|uniref:Hydroxyacid dehydrogenase n=1 Tax=Billgrantia endophytica TaxID=2033802 RepID=A0A2N7UEF9_9GAMM|nr:FAD-binding oxidoreductase [Halomonas endophytica]PMR78771.1 hydroxyacid dehydrogenase [Halomonas endophytica]
MTPAHAKASNAILPEGFAQALAHVCSKNTLITDSDSMQRFLIEERSLFTSNAEIVVAPSTAQEVSRIISLCAQWEVPVVPQGGNTGLVGGTVAGRGEVLMSLQKLNRILEVDAENFTITVEAGCILADVQKAASDVGCFFPLSLGAEGSCTIGGNIASNAGGIGVLKYGNTRELTLGLEVILSDGRIWNGMRPLYKDNTGYSLKNLFIGSEGSLGIVTKAILKLYPAHIQRKKAFCALNSPRDALTLLALARKRSGDDVTAFELMSRFSLEIVTKHTDNNEPFSESYPWYALIEFSTSRTGNDLELLFEAFAEEAFETGLILDAVVAQSVDQEQRLAALRESIPEAQKKAGGSIKHDVSVPVSKVPDLIEKASAAVLALIPDAKICAFGHVGDGNVHFNVTQPDGADRKVFLERWDDVNAVVYEATTQLGGSISAEHGIGLLKVYEINHYRDPVEGELMRTIKAALDPYNIMNPGKLVAS